jgi:hypothetical protein|tara:strand:- start:1248 stop:1535 length:288 start_codon:yes stop_codon:yes gene_type:complete
MKDNYTVIGELKTLSIQDHNAEEFAVGIFEMPVTVDTAMLLASGDKRAFIGKTIAIHLAEAIQSTTVPSHLWYIELHPKITKELPSLGTTIVFGE